LYSVDGQTVTTKNDFNDTSTVLKVTFPKENSSSNAVTALLYGDLNMASQVLTDVYPTATLQADIISVPHHGYQNQSALMTGNGRVYLYFQHKGPVYGADNNVTTVDMYGTYR
jgi:hypothetical protein